MFTSFRRAILAVALLAVTGAGLSACVAYDDGRYHRGGWNDRGGWHGNDHDHDRRW